jgi:transcriptional regulator with XRE-family HTH domain
MKLGQQLETILKERRLSLSQLARETKIPKATLHGWMTGQRSVDPDQVRRVAAKLEVSVHYLLFGEADPRESQVPLDLEPLFSGDVRISIQRIKRD